MSVSIASFATSSSFSSADSTDHIHSSAPAMTSFAGSHPDGKMGVSGASFPTSSSSGPAESPDHIHSSAPEMTSFAGSHPAGKMGVSGAIFPTSSTASNEEASKSNPMRTIETLLKQHPLIEDQLRALITEMEDREAKMVSDKAVEQSSAALRQQEEGVRCKELERALEDKERQLRQAQKNIDDLEGTRDTLLEKIAGLSMQAENHEKLWERKMEAAHARSTNLRRNICKMVEKSNILSAQLNARNKELLAVREEDEALKKNEKDFDSKLNELLKANQALDKAKVTTLREVDAEFYWEYYNNQKSLYDFYFTCNSGAKKENYEYNQRGLYDLYFSLYAVYSPLVANRGFGNNRPSSSKGKEKAKDFRTGLREVVASLRDHYILAEEPTGESADPIHGSKLLTMIEAARENLVASGDTVLMKGGVAGEEECQVEYPGKGKGKMVVQEEDAFVSGPSTTIPTAPIPIYHPLRSHPISTSSVAKKGRSCGS